MNSKRKAVASFILSSLLYTRYLPIKIRNMMEHGKARIGDNNIPHTSSSGISRMSIPKILTRKNDNSSIIQNSVARHAASFTV